MVVFEREYGFIEYDELTPAVIAHFDKFMTSAEFREFLDVGLDYLIKMMKENDCEVLWLADTRNHSVQSNEDTQWVADVWNVRAYENGLRHVAFVMPRRIFAQASVDNYARHNKQKKVHKMELEMFETIENALLWFKECKKKDSVR